MVKAGTPPISPCSRVSRCLARPLCGRRVRKLGQGQPPCSPLLVAKGGVGVLSEAVGQLGGVDRLAFQSRTRPFEGAGADAVGLGVQATPIKRGRDAKTRAR